MNRNLKNLTVWSVTGSAVLLPLSSPVAAVTGDMIRQNNRVEGMESAPEEYQTFEKDSLIYRVLSGRKAEIMAVRDTDIEELTIPDTVEVDGTSYTPVKIGSMVFMGMPNLTRVELSSAVEEVSQGAFISCPKLKEVRFSDHARKAVLIKNGAFENCPKLRSVILPDVEVTLEGQVFNGTKSVSLYRHAVDTSADLGEYSSLYMGLYENRKKTAQKEAGELPPEGFDEENEASTYSGVNATGWLLADNEYRYLTEGNKLAKNTFLTIAGKVYYFDDQGNMVRGWKEIEGDWYYFYPNGTKATNTEIDGYALDSRGVRTTYSWQLFDNAWRYVSTTGQRLTSTFQEINGMTYYFDRNGNMKRGWLTLNGESYYFYSDGIMARDTYVDGYYVDKDGKWNDALDKPMWVKSDGKWWYRHVGGSCTRDGWELIDGKEYYFDEEGYMQTGWIAVNGKWYYCMPNGEKAKDTWIGTYYVDENGIWSDSEWITTSQGKMYRYQDGTYARGWKTINGKRYYFNSQGYLQTGWQTIDGKLYFLSADGDGGEIANQSRYSNNSGNWSYSGKNNLHGVDISHWQSGINASAIPADFIIAKATGGKGFLDASFHTYAKQAQSSGKLFGMYHFARDNGYQGDAKEEAEFFYSVVKNYIGWGVPILDWEADLHLGPKWVKTFLDRFYELSGVKCMLYTSMSVTRAYDWSDIEKAGYKLWVAQYANMKNVIGYDEDPWRDSWGTGAFRTITMHQYTSRGKLPGYNGNLDMNVFYGTKEDWNKLAKKS